MFTIDPTFVYCILYILMYFKKYKYIHGRTRSIAACSKPRFTRNQEMSNCPTDGAVCPPKKYRNK